MILRPMARTKVGQWFDILVRLRNKDSELRPEQGGPDSVRFLCLPKDSEECALETALLLV